MRTILYIHYQVSDRDGSSIHVMEFCKAFSALCAERGLTFRVASPYAFSANHGKKGWLSRLKSELAPYYLHDIKTVLLQLSRTFWEGAFLKREKPDVVLTRYNENTLSILWACRRRRIPVVLEINTLDKEKVVYKGHYRHFPWVQKLFSLHNAIGLADGAFGVSEVIVDELRASIRSQIPLEVIPNGVAVDSFVPGLSGEKVRAELSIGTDKLVVGYVGSFPVWHHLEELVKRAPSLLKSDPLIHLLLVGELTKNEAWLIRDANRIDLAPHMTLTGFVQPKKIPEFIAAIDVAVLPDTADYCSPLKIFEYMAMAKAIVAPATRAITDILKDGDEALLFSPGDYDGMIQAILRLAGDPGLRIRLGLAARQRVCRQFSWYQNAEKVYALLEMVMHGCKERQGQR